MNPALSVIRPLGCSPI